MCFAPIYLYRLKSGKLLLILKDFQSKKLYSGSAWKNSLNEHYFFSPDETKITLTK